LHIAIVWNSFLVAALDFANTVSFSTSLQDTKAGTFIRKLNPVYLALLVIATISGAQTLKVRGHQN